MVNDEEFIKLHRELFNSSLADAKKAVDQMAYSNKKS
jgi:ribosomal protein L7/L12